MNTRTVGVAYHEAGHVILNHHLGIPYTRVSVVPCAGRQGSVEGSSLGRQTLLDEPGNAPETMVRLLPSWLAGNRAEALFAGGPHRSGVEGENDWVEFRHLIACLQANGLCPDPETFIAQQVERTDAILRHYQPAVGAVANALPDRLELSREEVEGIIAETVPTPCPVE